MARLDIRELTYFRCKVVDRAAAGRQLCILVLTQAEGGVCEVVAGDGHKPLHVTLVPHLMHTHRHPILH